MCKVEYESLIDACEGYIVKNPVRLDCGWEGVYALFQSL